MRYHYQIPKCNGSFLPFFIVYECVSSSRPFVCPHSMYTTASINGGNFKKKCKAANNEIHRKKNEKQILWCMHYLSEMSSVCFFSVGWFVGLFSFATLKIVKPISTGCILTLSFLKAQLIFQYTISLFALPRWVKVGWEEIHKWTQDLNR